MGPLVLCLCASCWIACSPSPPAANTYAVLQTMPVTLPNGAKIQAEVALTPQEHLTGMMFRDHVPPDHGMLFVFADMQPRSFYMYQTLIPLDILWIDADRRIAYISADTPPCPAKNAAACPNYGEGVPAQYVLELGGGQAAAQGLQVGDRLSF